MSALRMFYVGILVAIVAGYFAYVSKVVREEDSASVPTDDKERQEFVSAVDSRSIDRLNAFLTVHGNDYYAQVVRKEVAKLLGMKANAPPGKALGGAAAVGETASQKAPAGEPSAETAVTAAPERAPAADALNAASEAGRTESRNEPSIPPSAETGIAAAKEKDLAAEAVSGTTGGEKTQSETAPSGAPPAESDVADVKERPAAGEGVDAGPETGKTESETAPSGPPAAETNAAAAKAGAPTAAALSSTSPDAKAESSSAPSNPPSPGGEVASLGLDENCDHDEERLERLRRNPVKAEAIRLEKGLMCERLRPQVARLVESLSDSSPISSAAIPNPPRDQGSVPQSKPGVACVSDRDTLAHLRAEPSAKAARKFWMDLQCEQLRPQLRRLLESVSDDPGTLCREEADELNRIRADPSRRDAERFARDMACETLKPQVKRLLESLTE